MAKLGWNEIRDRAIKFSREWEGTTSEKAEAQTFWNEFFDVFGIRRRSVAAFEEPVKKIKGSYGFIDLFWPGRLLAEHKSTGESLDKAESQAFRYIQDLMTAEREDEVPRYILISDFVRIRLYDLEPEDQGELFKDLGYQMSEILVADLHKEVKHFAFIPGHKTHRFGEEDPANIEAAEIMADLHDVIEAGKYPPEDLERLLVRILFCLFADDTGIFDPGIFQLYIENRTKADGSDLGAQLNQIFDVLDTPVDQRQSNLDEDLAAFPYVNGDLFAGHLRSVAFTRDMRNRLMAACYFDWTKISPAIFGSLFQGIMDAKARRQIGAHYTSERDIMKVIRPLFLDELHDEFAQIKKDRSSRRTKRLEQFREKLTNLKFLDPACGCGNFLVIAYRELRRLEIDALRLLYNLDTTKQQFSGGELASLSRVDVDQFYGIEIGEWPARIAETALWLTDHQMNIELSEATGNLFQRIPLKASPHIKCANALRMDWNELLPAKECSYVLGNPPFVGHHYQTKEQKIDHRRTLENISARGVLDYVCNWYVKAAEYIRGHRIRCALVSTNSICQGEQAGLLWSELYGRYHLKIHFAHRTFAWKSEARGAAHVHVVIVGFSDFDHVPKRLFDYADINGEPKETNVTNISPYLVEGLDFVVTNRSSPLCNVPRMRWGNKPTDGGHLILSPEERAHFLQVEPQTARFIRRYVGGGDFIKGIERYCLWLVDADPKELRKSKLISERLVHVRESRLESKAESTRRYAEFPALFRQVAQPDSDYLAIPEVSSERRPYIPIAFLSLNVICSNTMQFVPEAHVFHFGVLTSMMHMAWLKLVGGRLKSDFRYSNSLVYNNFPWPEPTDEQRAKVEGCAQGVLDARQPHLDGGATLADLYDPLTMPGDLLKAHQALDRAVDRCYRKEKFHSERERVEYLFRLYEQLTAPLAMEEKPKKGRRKKKG